MSTAMEVVGISFTWVIGCAILAIAWAVIGDKIDGGNRKKFLRTIFLGRREPGDKE